MSRSNASAAPPATSGTWGESTRRSATDRVVSGTRYGLRRTIHLSAHPRTGHRYDQPNAERYPRRAQGIREKPRFPGGRDTLTGAGGAIPYGNIQHGLSPPPSHTSTST